MRSLTDLLPGPADALVRESTRRARVSSVAPIRVVIEGEPAAAVLDVAESSIAATVGQLVAVRFRGRKLSIVGTP